MPQHDISRNYNFQHAAAAVGATLLNDKNTKIVNKQTQNILRLAQLERCNNKFENFGHYSLNIAKYKITQTLLLNFANENKQNISNHD